MNLQMKKGVLYSQFFAGMLSQIYYATEDIPDLAEGFDVTVIAMCTASSTYLCNEVGPSALSQTTEIVSPDDYVMRVRRLTTDEDLQKIFAVSEFVHEPLGHWLAQLVRRTEVDPTDIERLLRFARPTVEKMLNEKRPPMSHEAKKILDEIFSKNKS